MGQLTTIEPPRHSDDLDCYLIGCKDMAGDLHILRFPKSVEGASRLAKGFLDALRGHGLDARRYGEYK